MKKFVVPDNASVYLPREDRNILAEGEVVEVNGYIERLIASGCLKVVEVTTEVEQKTEENEK